MTELFSVGRRLAQLHKGELVTLEFVTPTDSVCLAAFCEPGRHAIDFYGSGAGYASNIGLKGVLRGEEPDPNMGALAGLTYSPLNRLCLPQEVEFCNTMVNDVFRQQLSGHPDVVVAGICKIVGELHDNVASHAQGVGYSAAQIYKGRLWFAIADTGRGFLTAVREVEDLPDDSAAIEWAFQKGNTSVRKKVDPWAQRWAPGATDVQADYGADPANHHQGLGLWHLEQLVKRMSGTLFVWSGDGLRMFQSGRWADKDPSLQWQGVVVEMELPIRRSARPPDSGYSKEDEQLAKDLGL